MNLIFDLDGTLIDSRMRLYCLFQKLVPECNLSFEKYWDFKRRKISHETILNEEFGFDAADIAKFHSEWMSKIEAPEFLCLDRKFPAMHEALERLQRQAKLFVCTARQSKKSVTEQLGELDLLMFFEDVMVTEQRFTKYEMLRRISNIGQQDWIIGDTGLDVLSGKKLGLKTCAVLSGFLSEKSLLEYSPDLILPYASDFDF